MFNNINSVYEFVVTEANKQYAGSLTPAQFNICAPIAQLNYMRWCLGLPEDYSQNPQYYREAPMQLETTQRNDDMVLYFSNTVPLTSTGQNLFTIPTDFIAYRPSSYKFVWQKDDGTTDWRWVPIEFVTSGERVIRLDDYVNKPTPDYPILSYQNGKMLVDLDVKGEISINQIQFSYIRKPLDPFRNYVLDPLTDRDTYVALGSVDFEFNVLEWEQISQRILKYWATKIREEGLFQTANMAVQTGK